MFSEMTVLSVMSMGSTLAQGDRISREKEKYEKWKSYLNKNLNGSCGRAVTLFKRF
jgi:hypothetical protein